MKALTFAWGLACICVTLGTDALSAQSYETSLVGQQVRITTDTTLASTTLTGTMVRVDSFSVWLLRRDKSEVRIPLASVERLQIRGGKRSNWLKGGIIGAAIGSGGVALVALSDSDAGEFGQLVALLIGVGAGGGALVGTLVGSQIKSDGWKTVDRGRLQLSTSGRTAPHVTVSFVLRF